MLRRERTLEPIIKGKRELLFICCCCWNICIYGSGSGYFSCNFTCVYRINWDRYTNTKILKNHDDDYDDGTVVGKKNFVVVLYLWKT